MPIIKVETEHIESGERKTFLLNNVTGEIFDSVEAAESSLIAFKPVSLSNVGKEGPFRVIKIQLGMSCNYECSYCSQRFVERPEETSQKDIESFMEKFVSITKDQTLRVEFWGGEPLVYWKTLKPLAEKIKDSYPNVKFSIITNGSLLTPEKILWLDRMEFHVAISHDGPGHSFRGPDPLKDNGRNIRLLIDLLLPKGRFSFNSMLHKENSSRLAIIEWFERELPGVIFPFGEMGLIDAYDADGLGKLEMTTKEHFNMRRLLWSEIRFQSKTLLRCPSQASQASNVRGGEKDIVGQKCGMDKNNIISIDLNGNVITCQNVTSAAIAPNGESHKIGSVDNLKDVRLKTSTHWSEREHCSKCPVLSLCAGSCMFLEGDNWSASCNASFDDKVALLAFSIENRTGYVPVKFDADWLPKERQDIWGSVYDWDNIPDKKPKKTISIKAI